MLTCLSGGHVVDPVNGTDCVGDVYFEDGRIVARPDGRKPDATHDVSGHVVMAGAIDIHSHIAGGSVNTARLLLPEAHRAHKARPAATPLSTAGWSTFQTGRLYAQMGYTTVIEPAVSPHHALHAHLEMADIPIIDKAFLTVLGNEPFVLESFRDNESLDVVQDYIGSTLEATRAIGIKCVNAGGVDAFKKNVRAFSLDDVVPEYGLTSREIFQRMQRATHATGIRHPLHLHMNNLGLPGNVETACATIDASQGLRLHLAHVQFYAYGKEGKNGFSSAAAQFAEKINANKNVSVDVGQVMFADIVTISSDVMKQFNSLPGARPKKGVILDAEGNGSGVLPYSYRVSDFFNAIQWAAGLELFLLTNDPMRVFFTTDHPNGAPFTTYPEVFALLMSADKRAQWLSRLPADVVALTNLPSITREYTIQEIATMTRAAPRALYGFEDRGSLGAGCVADVAVYKNNERDRAEMFRHAAYVFKDGELVVRDGAVARYTRGKTLHVKPDYNKTINKRIDAYYDDLYGLPRDMFAVDDAALPAAQAFAEVPCRS